MLGLGRSPAHFDQEIASIENDAFRLRSGALRVVVRTSSLSYQNASPEQQARTVHGFRELLQAQTGPFQLYLRSRRKVPGDTAEPDPRQFPDKRNYLSALTRSFIATHLADTPVFERDTFVVLAPGQRHGLLRSWVFRFREKKSDQPEYVAVDSGVPLRDRARELIEHLRRMGITGRQLNDEELAALATELYLRPAPGPIRSGELQRAGSVEVSGRHYASFVVDRYPGEEVEPGWLLPLLSFKGEIHVGIHVVPLETDRMLALLRHKIRDLKADEMATAESGSVLTNTLGTLPDAVTVHQALARNEEKAFAVSFYATVGGADPADLRSQVEALQASCRRMMIRAVQPFFEMRNGLLSSWPLGLDLLGREQILHTSALATLLPWLQEDLADPEGHYWGYNKETGGLCVFDPFDETRFPNANIAVLAHSGAGKSYAAASVVLSGHTRGIGAILLDPEAEYGRMVRALEGTYLHLAAGSAHAINVLDPLFAGNAEDVPDQINDVLDLVALMCGKLDEVERAQLEAAVRQLIARPTPVPVLGDVFHLFQRAHPQSRVTTILGRWVSGDLGRLFSAPTNVDLAADIVGFNLRDLKEELIPPASLLLANWLWASLRRERRPRHLLIDEAGLLLEHEPIRRFLVRLARRIRKYGGSLILVSQNPGDFFETKDGAVLITNPSILLLGSQKHSEAAKLQKAFSLTDRQVAFLETAQRGDFLLLAGPNRLPVHIMAPPWMDELIVQSRGH